MNRLLCQDAVPSFMGFFDFSIAPQLLFYSYIPILLALIILGFFILNKNSKNPKNIGISLISFFSALWIADVLVLWTSAYASYVMFFWQLLAAIEVSLFASALYTLFAFREIKLTEKRRFIIFLPVLIVLCLLPTPFNLIGFDLYNCEGVIGSLWKSLYIYECVVVSYLGFNVLRNFLLTKVATGQSKSAVGIQIGLFVFLLIFTITNILGDATGIYSFNLLGPLGIAVFVLTVGYLLSNTKQFGGKVIGSHLLIIALWSLVASLLFIDSVDLIHVLILITLIVFIPFGVLLINSIRREVMQREKIENLAKSLEESNAKLEESNALKSKFLSIASHQFRSPVTALKGYAELILDGSYGEITPKLQEPLERIFTSSNNLALIVNDFLNLSRIESGRMEYTFGMHDVREIAQSAVAEQMPIVHQRGNIHLRFSNDGQENYNAVLDPGMIKQVLTNIIDNAIKYTPEGEIHVRIEKDETKNVIRFSTTDAGVGIPPESIDKLFSQFSRASNANTINVMGTGLGLYIAKEIIKAHNGNIWAESMGEGKGSTFVVELPITISHS